MTMELRDFTKHGWRRTKLESRAAVALFPMAWGLLPLAFGWLMWFTSVNEDLIPFFGIAGMLLILLGGLAGLSSRMGALGASRVGIGLFCVCFSIVGWALVAQESMPTIAALLMSSFSVVALVKGLDVVFKDAGYVFERTWGAKVRLPVDSLLGWEIKTTRFSQQTMASKRFNSNQFVTIYGRLVENQPTLCFDVLGCKDKTEFQSLNFGIDLDGFTEAMSDAEE
jgi:hypothetical protein